MLSRIPVHRFNAMLSILSCRASIALRRPIISRYFAPTCSHRRLLSDSPAATAAAKDRRSVILSSAGRRRPDDSSFVADANTVAECRTSRGRRLRVSFRCAAPPSSSNLYYDLSESSNDPYYDDYDQIKVVAAHGELVLLRMSNRRSCCAPEEFFVYRPAGACRPPSLSLLPVLESPIKPESVVPASYFDHSMFSHSRLDSGGIGLLRRGENDDVLVVHVDMWYDRNAGWEKAVFCVLRHGMRRWELMEPVPVSRHCGSTEYVICVGGRFLCCICYRRGFLLCDMADEANPKVRYVELPPEVTRCSYSDDSSARVQRMGVVGDSSVRFVSIHPNCCRSVDPDRDLYSDERYYDEDCCCRNGDRMTCLQSHPRFVFTMRTWTMNLSMDGPLEWVEEEEIDGEEIWALPGYEGLPQAIPEWPVMCLDKPDVVCFVVSNYHFTKGIQKKWMVQLNITTKTLISVVQLYRNDDDYWSDDYCYHLPAEFQY